MMVTLASYESGQHCAGVTMEIGISPDLQRV